MDNFVLISGHHADAPATGMGCVMDAVSLIANPRRSRATDQLLDCVCPVVRRYVIPLNDATWPTDETRTLALLPLAERIANSRVSHRAEVARAWRLAVGAATDILPRLIEQFRLSNMKRHAVLLRGYTRRTPAAQMVATLRDALSHSRNTPAETVTYSAANAVMSHTANPERAASFAATAAASAARETPGHGAPVLLRAVEHLSAALDIKRVH